MKCSKCLFTVCPKRSIALCLCSTAAAFSSFFFYLGAFFVGQPLLVNYLFDSPREHTVFSALASSFTRREIPSAKQSRENIAVTSAASDQPKFTLHFRRGNARVFEWISRKYVGKYSGRSVEKRMGSFRVWKTQQASRGSLLTCCWIFQLVSESL